MTRRLIAAIGTSSTGMTHRTIVAVDDDSFDDTIIHRFRYNTANCSTMGSVRRTVVSRVESVAGRTRADFIAEGRTLCAKCFPVPVEVVAPIVTNEEIDEINHDAVTAEIEAERESEILGEHTFAVEAEAHAARRAFIDAGRPVSLIGFDPAREVYAFDVMPAAPIVVCEAHGGLGNPHTLADSCLYPHEIAPSGSRPSMVAVETHDPREAVPAAPTVAPRALPTVDPLGREPGDVLILRVASGRWSAGTSCEVVTWSLDRGRSGYLVREYGTFSPAIWVESDRFERN